MVKNNKINYRYLFCHETAKNILGWIYLPSKLCPYLDVTFCNICISHTSLVRNGSTHTMTARVCERLMWCNSVCHLQKSACVVSIIPGKSKFIFNRHLLISFSRIRGKTSDSKRKKNHSKIFFFFFWRGGEGVVKQHRKGSLRFSSSLSWFCCPRQASLLPTAKRSSPLKKKKREHGGWENQSCSTLSPKVIGALWMSSAGSTIFNFLSFWVLLFTLVGILGCLALEM